MPLFEFKRRSTRRRWLFIGSTLTLVATMLLIVAAATASHPEVSLPGSNFEIDTDANLKVDDPAPSIDWASVTETRATDKPSGATDDSFGQGTKEDTAVPTVVNGSIPPNKSDLLHFGVYLEQNASGRFLNLFWHRVQEPSGTTNMDFEFNKSSTISANRVTPVRSAGDLLIQYDLTQGGTNPQLFLSRWVTSGAGSQCEASNSTPCWGERVNLSAAGDATGSINTSNIPAAESDGLGNISPRTFGEAQLDFDALTGGGCAPFGSAYLKSRSSDSFTAALKDFIAPAALNINSCGAIKVVKTSSKTGNGLAGATFSVAGPNNFSTTLTTGSDGTACVDQLPFGSYTVTETGAPTGFVIDDPAPRTVVVDNAASCGGNPYVGETSSFTDTPTADIQVRFRDGGSGETALDQPLSCNNATGTSSTADTANWEDTLTVSGVKITSNVVTITCTIVIDP
jgi:hypothetical protein